MNFIRNNFINKTFLEFTSIFVLLVITACKNDNTSSKNSSDHSYKDSVKQWRMHRYAALKATDGWLNLAGLYWLSEGINKVGSASSNKVNFPDSISDAFLGAYIVNNDTIAFKATSPSLVYHKDSLILSIEQVFPSEENVVLKHKDLAWFVIKRGDKYAVRLRDYNNKRSKNFDSVPTFPIDAKWRVKAKFLPTPDTRLTITDITNHSTQKESPGTLSFEIGGNPYTLSALADKDSLFIVFGDKTNDKETYQAGRFLYVSKPDQHGDIWLDFNKAYNPPCAFTPYSTCPKPPDSNMLPIAITAGEKRYED